jgi:hypothetical protein
MFTVLGVTDSKYQLMVYLLARLKTKTKLLCQYQHNTPIESIPQGLGMYFNGRALA